MNVMQIKVALWNAGWPKELTNDMNEEQLRSTFENKLNEFKSEIEPEAGPDHPAFAWRIKAFKEAAEQFGFEKTYCSWIAGHACGCMGPQNGDPYCPCSMTHKTAQMMGKVVPTY